MNIHPIHSIQAAYRRAAAQNALADTEDLLEMVAKDFGLPPEAIEHAIEMPDPLVEVHHVFGRALTAAMQDHEAAIRATAQHLALPVQAVRSAIASGDGA